ncbi:GNAT family N-acetyltransferase [Tropicimonas aquimaris]|uniref:GNAT family N-acetyltransferase n=1 Tax=Tropicimonas aquimaris TaxID=914152 RepID=A0ABW3IW47_9RHOB
MSRLEREALFSTIDATWPAARYIDIDGWRLREGAGGGNRVSAATAAGDAPEISAMEEAQAGLGQDPLVMIRPGEEALDARLEAAGYRVKDPVVLLACPVERLAKAPPPVTAFHVAWPPMQVQAEIWAEGGIGPARLAVMDRVMGPRLSLLGRAGDQPAATGFVALHGDIAMLHALEVAQEHRRKGVARHLMQAAALWARDEGAARLSVLVTLANAPARALYASLGMEAVEEYHYRTR